MERVIKILEDKRNSFIGSLKDQVTVAKSQGFRDGLQYAIEVLKMQIEQDELAKEHQQEFEDQLRASRSYENDW